MANQTQQTSAPEYFNLHTNGIGYLNRVRWVHSNKGGRKAEPFLACSISALRGAADDVSYTSFDLRVSGEEAIDIVSRLEDAVKEGRKVIVNFRIGDIYPHLYERDEHDQKTGRPTGRKEWAALIKGRLILINTVKVDGDLTYQRSVEEDEERKAPQQEVQAAPAPVQQRSEEPQPRQRVQRERPQGQQGYRQKREYAYC